ncbi:cholesterol 7-desaturase nvd [Zeugodacus cucurbitae]|uniref:cholesterol 7-desaturase n=1 Tax=Zeugodacus cucurbitae TaxID=28588 RepID=A0A0A1XI70_ZEUCU|nr:cholesterol 7-desaturase nvd [Zeugodacus cucurbitae]XP_011194162.1 cholesterol 7-desaturase nvd [Zeugodacus cucurbitae]
MDVYWNSFLLKCNFCVKTFHLLTPENMFSIITILFIVTIYWLFLVPCNWKKRHAPDISFNKRNNRSRLIGLKQLPPPYPNGWYCILESSLLKPESSRYVSCLGEHFAIFRNIDGEVSVLNAYCPHLGANMAIGGRINGDNIECPFHQWSFRGSDGSCANIPYSCGDRKGIKVRKWICREINDNIFIWYHSESEKILWELPLFTSIENKELVFQGSNEFYVDCHIQEIPENGADLAHFSAVHQTCLFSSGQNPDKSLFLKYVQHHWKAAWSILSSSKSHIATLHLTHHLQLFFKYQLIQVDIKARQIGPSFVHMDLNSSVFGHIEILQTVTPIEPLVQKVSHRFYASRALGPIIKILIFAESVMFERDMAIWNHKLFRSTPLLVKEDIGIKKFRMWFSQFYTENSKSFIDARKILDW